MNVLGDIFGFGRVASEPWSQQASVNAAMLNFMQAGMQAMAQPTPWRTRFRCPDPKRQMTDEQARILMRGGAIKLTGQA